MVTVIIVIVVVVIISGLLNACGKWVNLQGQIFHYSIAGHLLLSLPPPSMFSALNASPSTPGDHFQGPLDIRVSNRSLSPELISWVPGVVSPFAFCVPAPCVAILPGTHPGRCADSYRPSITRPLASMPRLVPHSPDLIQLLWPPSL